MPQSDWQECQISHMKSLKSAGRNETFQRFGRLLSKNGIQHGFEDEILPADPLLQKKVSTTKASFIDESEITSMVETPVSIDVNNPRLQRGRVKPTNEGASPLQSKVVLPARVKPR